MVMTMPSKVSIWNMALTNVGSSGFVQSPTEQSAEASHCRVVYDNAVLATLESMDWSFARKKVALADLGTPDDDWLYQYAYPTNCAKARKILTKIRNAKPLPFEIGINSAGTQKVINTDAPDAVLIYTMKVTNEALFNSVFAEVLSWKMALLIAPAIAGNDKKILDSIRGGLAASLSNAHAVDSNEGQEDDPKDASWIDEYK
jgi:hypothetical protein